MWRINKPWNLEPWRSLSGQGDPGLPAPWWSPRISAGLGGLRPWVPWNYILDSSLLDTFHASHPDRPAPRGRGRPPRCRGPQPSGAGQRVLLTKKIQVSTPANPSALKVQGSRFFIICHIHNHTGYNKKWNVSQDRSAQWKVQKN